MDVLNSWMGLEEVACHSGVKGHYFVIKRLVVLHQSREDCCKLRNYLVQLMSWRLRKIVLGRIIWSWLRWQHLATPSVSTRAGWTSSPRPRPLGKTTCTAVWLRPRKATNWLFVLEKPPARQKVKHSFSLFINWLHALWLQWASLYNNRLQWLVCSCRRF